MWDLPKKGGLGQFADLRGGEAGGGGMTNKRGVVFFTGGGYPNAHYGFSLK